MCEMLVEPAVARKHLFNGWCVYNDSNAFFCDKPLCEHSQSERHPAGPRSGVASRCMLAVLHMARRSIVSSLHPGRPLHL